ncbi:MAG TPA: glutamate racemase [Steroidobacteraceae bacterium]|nr:glutamate racemase [Steroidobacteraceae bacterium]
MSKTQQAQLPIGVFDSGVGGLTVLRALRSQLPREEFIYLGDTARLPYGTKSAASVERYSIQAAQFLVGRGIKCLVVACNTASAVALDALRSAFAPVPVIGVVEPGAAAACAESRTGHIAVLATEGTVQGGAYQRAIARLRPDAVVHAQPCSLFVALAEEGWNEGPIAESIARRYLSDILKDEQIDTLLLGCTHFPVLTSTLAHVVGSAIHIVDSARTTANMLARELRSQSLLSERSIASPPKLMATDGPERFARVGSRFLGESFTANQVELVDLGKP